MAVMALNDADAILIGVLVICMVPRMSVIRFLEPAAGAGLADQAPGRRRVSRLLAFLLRRPRSTVD